MLTRIVAIRHGKPQSEGYASDELRPLSEEGKSTQRIATENLKKLGIVPDLILSSPLLRAQQTADVISDVFGGVPIQSVDALGNEFESAAIMALLPPPSENKTVFLVGHAPTLGSFVNDLVGDNVLPMGLSKSSSAVVDFRHALTFGEGEFAGYYQP